MLASSRVPIAVGETFERYEIESLIGRGGMGEVYRAVDTRLRRKVALKVLRPDRDNAEAVARLFREARSAAALTHPNTVAIHDVGESEGIFYIVMELVTGASLLTYVGDARVPVARKLSWLVDVARALSVAHKAGVIHRDVKPSNVMVSDEGAVKVLDFGLAKALTAKALAPVSFRTQQGHVLGTPRYMAPEQLAGNEVDARSDQYAYALTAYEVVAGKHPGGALAGSIVPPRLDQVMPEVSRAVADVIARAMANKPDQRFGSMQDVAVALEDAIAGRPARDPGSLDTRDRASDASDASEITALEATANAAAPGAPPATMSAPVADTVRFGSAPMTVAATTKRAGGAGADVVAKIERLPEAPAPEAPASEAPAPEAPARESEADIPTATARTVAAAAPPVEAAGAGAPAARAAPAAPPDLAKTTPLAAPPMPMRTLMSREAPTPPAQPIAKTLLTAAGPPGVADAARPAGGAGAAGPVGVAGAAWPVGVAGAAGPTGVAAPKIAPAPPGAEAGPTGSPPSPPPKRWPVVAVAIVVIGACAFVGAYFGSNELARRSVPAPSASPSPRASAEDALRPPSATVTAATTASTTASTTATMAVATAASMTAASATAAPVPTPALAPSPRPATGSIDSR